MLINTSFSTTFSIADRNNISNDIAEKLEFYGYRPVYPRTKNPIMAKHKSAAYLYKRISALWKSKSKETFIRLIDLRNSELNAGLEIRLLPSKNKNFCLTVQSFEIVTLPSQTSTPVPME